MAAPTPSQVSLKLLVDKNAKKVLFAEASNEMVDFLCSILTLPMGTVISLLSEQGMVGSLSNLYKSIECLNDDYIQPNQYKDSVLKPMACSSFQSSSPVIFPSLTYAPKNENQEKDSVLKPMACFSFQSSSPVLPSLTYAPKKESKFYIQPNQHKDSVLKPMACSSFQSSSPVLPSLTYAPNKENKFYRCPTFSNHNYVSDKSGSPCPSCGVAMDIVMTLVEAGNAAGREVASGGGCSGGGGFVKGVVTYMVMDDMVVVPMSTITGITLLNRFNVTDVSSLEEKVVHLDMPKALKLLKISLQSKNVLTTVFL